MGTKILGGRRVEPQTSDIQGVSALSAAGRLGFAGAFSANFLNMVGIGPFITIPLALAAMGGPQALLGWVAGAFLCACDGMVWAELASRLPYSGGPYYYLREAYGRNRLGHMFGFLYLWLTLLIGPLSIASGAVGFAHYVTALVPAAHGMELKLIAAALCLLSMGMAYRNIRSIERLSVAIGIIVLVAIVWIIGSGVVHFDPARAFAFPHGAFTPNGSFWIGLGAASLISVYDYGGYNNVCMIAGEIKKPERTVPSVVLISIAMVAVLYLCLNVSIIGTVPWRDAIGSKIIVADFMDRIYGQWGSAVAVVLILVASCGSVFVLLLAYSRVPYAAAASGEFFAPFRKLHPKGAFPTVALLFMGVASAVASFLSLVDLIATLIVVQVMFQFLAQCGAVIALRRQPLKSRSVFRMPLYPIPVLICIVGWLYIVVTSKVDHIFAAAGMIVFGVLAYLLWSRARRAWPWRGASWQKD